MHDERVGEKRHRGGRRPSPVWAFFTEIRTAENKVHARCNFCSKRLAGVAARMRHHVLSKCVSAPTDMERLLDEAIASNVTFQTESPTATEVFTDASPVVAIESDSAAHSNIAVIQPTAEADPEPVNTVPVKRYKTQPQVQEEDEDEDEEEEVEAPTVEENQAADTMSDDAVEEEAVVEDRNDVQLLPTSGEYSETESDRVHQKLVLACVLNDVPPSFVEDEALMEAFAAARPGLPRITAEQAKTTVLQKLASAASKSLERELASCEVLTIVHRHFKERREGGEMAVQWCNRWVGVDERRKSVPLKETCREIEVSSFATDEACCRYCAPRQEFDAVVSTYRRSVAPEAVFCLCCECPQMYQQLRLEQQQALSSSVDDPASKTTTLLTMCLLRQSLVLRKELLDTFPAVLDLLMKAIFLGHSVSKITPLRPQLEGLLSSSSWDAVPRLVKRMVYLEGDIRRYQAKVSVPAEEVASFWNKLRVVDKLLTPFNWMLALTEAKETTSAQFIVLWLWLLAIVDSGDSELLPAQDKERFASVVLSLIRRYVDSHELVCMLLDPRIAGAGLSISGKRRVKSLVVQLAERVFPSGGFGSGASRSHLLTELADYTEKSGSFDDAVAWEMSAGRPPRLFWNDFVEDAPHLARVARAVISVSPYAQTASDSLNCPVPTQEFAWEQTFAVRQLKFQAHRSSPQATSSVGQYRSLLFPPAALAQDSVSDGTLSVEVDKALHVTNAPRWSASVETEVDALVTHQLSLMLKVGGDSELEGDSTRSTVEPPRSASQSVGPSWFAFRSSTDRRALEDAVKSFLPSATNII